jgi:hypothetical protein
VQWLIPVIPITQEIKRIKVWGQPRQIVRPYLNIRGVCWYTRGYRWEDWDQRLAWSQTERSYVRVWLKWESPEFIPQYQEKKVQTTEAVQMVSSWLWEQTVMLRRGLYQRAPGSLQGLSASHTSIRDLPKVSQSQMRHGPSQPEQLTSLALPELWTWKL